MKKITTLRKLLPFILLLAISINANAQNAPIGCNGQFFVTHGDNGTATSPTSVKKLSFSGSIITPSVFNTDPAAIGYNAIGINPLDGYMYGLRYPTAGNRPRLIRVGSGTPSNVVDLGEVSNGGGNLADEDIAYAGCFDAAGAFFFITDANEMYRITGNNFPTTSITTTFIGNSNGGGTGTNFFVDIAVDPVSGTMYGVTFNRRLCTINKTTGAVTFVATHAGTEYIASLFFDEVGNLYGYRQNGDFFLINKTTAVLTPAGTGPAYTYADGCSCSFGRVFHDITSQKGICPGLGGITNPEWDITVAVTNQTSSAKTGLTYTLEIPSNRFSMIETPAVIAARLFTAGLIPANNPALVTLSTVAPAAGATKNKIVVTSFQTGAAGSTVNFTLKLKVVTLGGAYAPVPLQSTISGLPVLIGSSDLSNDPTTAAPDDPTVITFCPNITLPVNLLSFTGSYKNGITHLNWVAENQINFSYYDVERSIDGNNFSSISLKSAQGNSTSKEYYIHNDDLNAESNKVFYYRLKMVDIDGSFKYSNIIVVRKEAKGLIGITINPNPVVSNNTATVRFEATAKGAVDFTVVDMAGRAVLKQQNNITEGANSVALAKLDRLQPGFYVLQMNDGTSVQTIKFVISK